MAAVSTSGHCVQRTELRVWAGPAQGGRWPALSPPSLDSQAAGSDAPQQRALFAFPRGRLEVCRLSLPHRPLGPVWLGMVAWIHHPQATASHHPMDAHAQMAVSPPPGVRASRGLSRELGEEGTIAHMVRGCLPGKAWEITWKRDPQRVQGAPRDPGLRCPRSRSHRIGGTLDSFPMRATPQEVWREGRVNSSNWTRIVGSFPKQAGPGSPECLRWFRDNHSFLVVLA